jgi:hypothetical protein
MLNISKWKQKTKTNQKTNQLFVNSSYPRIFFYLLEEETQDLWKKIRQKYIILRN